MQFAQIDQPEDCDAYDRPSNMTQERMSSPRDLLRLLRLMQLIAAYFLVSRLRTKEQAAPLPAVEGRPRPRLLRLIAAYCGLLRAKPRLAPRRLGWR